MKILVHREEQESVRIELSTFPGGHGGAAEHQLLLTVTDTGLSYNRQLLQLWKAYAYVAKKLLPPDAFPLFCRYFLSDAANQADLVMAKERENTFCALSLIQQPPLNGTKVAMWTWFYSNITAVAEGSGVVKATHNGYLHIWTGGAANRAVSAEFQTHLLLKDYVKQLALHDCHLASNCVRTWFFVQNVDVDYADVVEARKELFVTQGLTEKTHYIASTGIEGRHADPAVLVTLDTYAVGGLQPGQLQYLHAPSHLNPTYEYGVTFERGTAVHYGDRTQIFISGTASINNKGEIVAPGEILLQAERMMENIAVLLAEGGATIEDVTLAITYLRDPADYAVVKAYFEAHWPGMPHLIVHASVCRPGWLIETECLATVAADDPRFLPL